MANIEDIATSDGWYLDEDKGLVITVYQSDGTTPQSISGWSLSWMLKRRLTDADASAILTKTTASGIALTTPASGICTVTIADTDTTSIASGDYYHELKRTDAGYESVLVTGKAVLLRGVHRA